MQDFTPTECLTYAHAAPQSHRAKMQARRQRQRDRMPGFTAIRNDKLTSFYEGQKVMIAMAHTGANGKCSLKPDEIERQAFTALRQSLPALTCEKRHRRPTPSKSDNAAYRAGTR